MVLSSVANRRTKDSVKNTFQIRFDPLILGSSLQVLSGTEELIAFLLQPLQSMAAVRAPGRAWAAEISSSEHCSK